MGIIFSLVAFTALLAVALIGAYVPVLHYVFGIVIPYTAFAVFIIGIIIRVVNWARSPVPFRITTTCGQQKSLSFIKQNKIDNPFNGFQTFLRMAFEILAFRSLFRNTKAGIKDGSKLVYGASKWLWLFSIAFHYSFLVIILRHFRFFTEPVPFFVPIIQELDGFFQIGLPIIYITTAGITIGAGYLLFRRLYDSKIRYISLSSDYFPLFILLGIAVTGILMRHFSKVDLVGIKQLTVGLMSMQPVVPAGVDALFFVHLFLVCSLLIYFPMSKLMHMPGIFMSPTRNLPNNNRAKRHINPWNTEFKMHHHTYEEYEDEFRELMRDAGLPLDKEERNVN